MEEASERTPLAGSYGPPMYVFHTNGGRIYRNRVRQFQCCICGGILAMFILGVVIAISYTINSDFEDRNSTMPNGSDSTLEQQLQTLLTSTWPITDKEPQDAWPQPGPSQAQMEEALEAGRAAAEARRTLEEATPDLPVDSPSYRHQLAVATGPRANALAIAGFSMVEATKQLVKGMGKPPNARGPRVVSGWQADDACAEEDGVDVGGFPACGATPTPWRSLDGRCNNAAHPLRGAAFRPFRRVLPAAYADGVNAPRVASDGSQLPSAREVSVTVHRPQYRDDASFSILLAVWGQFMDHDITATALSKRSTDGKPISCCYAASAKMKAHPECFPVMLAEGDPFFHQFNVTCMEFVRSAPAPECRFGPREQLNQVSSFLDGSVVYGSNDEAARALREGEGGRLRMLRTADNRELLPNSTDLHDGCNRVEEAAKGRYCFASGDARANENLHLTTMHLLLARQHNRLAAELQQRNPGWGDERLYQEARRIVAAQMQHITYSEFVPIILGRDLSEKLSLQPRAEGYATDYDPDVDPRIANVFATAAFRFAHTLLPGLFRMISNSSSEYIELHKVLFNPFVLYAKGGEEATLRGALSPGLLRFDPHFSPQVSEHLFERDAPTPKPRGLDLVSLNIQRGRDHGLPAYPAWRQHCGFERPSCFDDLKGVMDEESLAAISAIFKSVDDIDAYSGMLAEVPIPGAMLGPTLTCLVADQLVRVRRGDRYWYETGEKPQAFTLEQLREVRKTSLAQVICDTSDAVSSIQRWVLRAAGADNPMVQCADLPRVDLDAWADPTAAAASFAHVAMGAGSGVRARAYGKPPLRPPGDPLDAGTPILRPLRLGAAVRSGRVTSAAQRAWYASFPLELHLPLFDSIAGGTPPAASVPNAYPHGILWEGSIVSSSPGYLSLSGQFSMPRYVHGDALSNFTVDWLNGDFEFQLQVLWNSSDVSALNFRGSYISPVYLRATEKYSSLQKESPNTLFDIDGEFRTLPSLDILPLAKTTPVILLGTYSADRLSFLWSGNVTVVIPDVVSVTPWSESSYWSEQIAYVPQEKFPWVPRSPEVEALPETAGATSALGITVTGGNVTIESDAGYLKWWDGKFPVAIPMTAFNEVVKASSKKTDETGKGETEPSFTSGVIWDATLQKQDNITLHLQGNFTVPLFIHGPGALYSIEWKNGNFSLDFKILGNRTLNGAFQEGYKYASPLFFRSKKPNDSLGDLIQDLETPSSVKGSAELQFVSASVAEAQDAAKAPIILHGLFTPDKSQFLWFGNATVILPAPYSHVRLEIAALFPSNDDSFKRVAVGAEVIGGSIDGGKAGSLQSTLWKGELPVPITRADIMTRGIYWKGELTQPTLTEIQLDGVYSIILPLDVNSVYSTDLFQGKFSLQLSLLWNMSVDGLLPPGTTVYSPIYLRGAAATDNIEAWFSVDEDLSHQKSQKSLPIGIFRVPIILQGAFSADLATFWWSGRVILCFPSALLTPTSITQKQKSKPLNIQLPTHSNPPLTNSYFLKEEKAGPSFFQPLRLGLTVRTARVTTSAGSAWSGRLPLQLPLPLFDSVAVSGDASSSNAGPPVYGHSIIWEAILSTSSLNHLSFIGKFSLPRYIHGEGHTNFSVEWINGEFDFSLEILWNTSDISNLNIQGSYFSPVFVGARQMYSHLQDVPIDILSEATYTIQLTPSINVSPLLKKAPIILLGTFSADKLSFIWTGNVSLEIPNVVSVPTWRPVTKIDEAYPTEKLSSTFQVSQVESLASIPATSSALGIYVTGGEVIGLTNGSYETWWNGSLPLRIPSHPFNKVIEDVPMENKGNSSSYFGSGTVWSAILKRQDDTTLRVKGNFSLPIFVHGPGSLFGIEWKIGNFSFDFKLLWNSTLDKIFQESKNYSSPIFFRDSKPYDTASDIIAEMQTPGSIRGSSTLRFLSTAVADASGLPRAPIIIHGMFSPDKMEFIWYGNATVILPSPTGGISLQMSVVSPKNNMYSPRIGVGGDVIGGSIVASDERSSPLTLWKGELPVSIYRPDIMARGVYWKGEITQTTLSEIQLNGTFSATIPTIDDASYPIALFQGKFSLQLSILWNISVAGLLSPGIAVYSPIYLRGPTAPVDSDSWFTLDEDPSNPTVFGTSEMETSDTLRVPIILEGAHSPDLTTFWWSGRVFMSFPTSLPSLTTISKQKNKKIILTKFSSLKSPNSLKGNSLIMADDNAGSSSFRPLRLGVTVRSARITTSAGTAWSGALPLQLPLPLFDSVAGPGDSSDSVQGAPKYAHGIVWKGTLSTSSVGYLRLSGQFSLPRYVHGGGLTNFSIQWINGNFVFDLGVLWNSSDVSNLNIGGTYSSPVFLSPRQEYSNLRDIPASSISDVTDSIKLIPSFSIEPVIKRFPIILFGTYSTDGLSFLWSGNVSFVIPEVVPIPKLSASNYWSEINGANPPGQLSVMSQLLEPEVLPAVPTSSYGLGIYVTGGNMAVLRNGSYESWWDGAFPLSLPSNPFNRMGTTKTKGVKSNPLYFASGIVWNAFLERKDTILRIKGNISLPIIVHGPGTLYAIDWKIGNFSLDFKLLWNCTIDGVFQEGKNYSSPIYFRPSKSTDTISDIITEFQTSGSLKDGSTDQFESTFAADALSLTKAPIIVHGVYSPDKTQFLWYGNATLLLPTSTGTSLFELFEKVAKGPTPVKTPKVAVGVVAIDGMAELGSSGTEITSFWSGEIPFPIRKPDLLSRGVTWTGESEELSPTDVILKGTFVAMWPSSENPSSPQVANKGIFSVNMSLLWGVSLNDILPAGQPISSPIYLKETPTLKESGVWFEREENNPERLAVQLALAEDNDTAIRVPIILHGTYSPDMATFWWTGRALFLFPAPTTRKVELVRQFSGKEENANSVGATVSSGAVLTAKGIKLWGGSLPVTLPNKLKSVVWNGVLTPSVGGTVDLRGAFVGPGGLGEFAFVLTPLWNTPLTSQVVPGVNYTSPLFLREPTDPALSKGITTASGTKVPIILQGSFSPDKSSFYWSGNVIIAFP